MRIPYDTTYFSEEDVRTAVNGCSHDFALAVHRRTGWKIGSIWNMPILDDFTIQKDPTPAHVFVYCPDGRPLNAEGIGEIETMKLIFGSHGRAKSVLDFANEAEYTKKMSEDADSLAYMLVPKEYRIAGAEKVISNSPGFLALIASLQGPAA